VAIAGGLDRDRFRAVAVLPERGELAELLEEADVEVVIQPLSILRREVLHSPGAGLALAARRLRDVRPLARLARERGAAIVHSNTSVVLAGQAIARRAGAPHVMHVREIYTLRTPEYEASGSRLASALWPLMRRRIQRADAVVCISDAVAAQFGGRTEVIHDGLPRVPEPADRSVARAALGVPEEAFCVALVGRVSDWKGQDLLALALARPELADIGAVGLVAGDTYPGNEDFEGVIRLLGDSLGLAERLRLLGFRDDLETVLGATDVVAVPSVRPEPLGLVALEAAAAGVPVVAAAHGGLTEIVRDGETGLLVPPSDQRALAAALRRLADEPELRRRLGEAAARDVRERFSRERMLRELQDLYEGISANR
jgi:glycosyltransferase involved in cell wall biosynthesis